MLALHTRALLCAALGAAAAAHLWAHRHMPAGWGRLAVALPVLAVLQLPPFLFNPLTETWAVVLSLNFPWLSVCAVRVEQWHCCRLAAWQCQAAADVATRPWCRCWVGPWGGARRRSPSPTTSPFWLS